MRNTIFYAVAILVVCVALFGIAVTLFVPNNAVTLNAAPGNTIVQMFSDPGSGAEASRTFRDGTSCTKLDGPMRFDLGGGITSDYYRLSCNGQTGYVNVKWVD